MALRVPKSRLLPQDLKKLVVTQDNELAGSIQDMILIEKRVLLLAASVIRRADTTLPSVRFDVADYRRIFGINNNNLTQDLLDMVDTITTRNIILPHGRRGKTSFSVISKITVVPGPESETGRAFVEVTLHSDMADFFLNLEGNFLSMPLLVYSAFRSNYALRLGEILASGGRGEKRYTVTFSTDDLKERLNCVHYKNFAQFRRRTLSPAKKENEKIGFLSFDWDEHRTGRAVSDLSFHVQLNSNVWSAERERGDIERIALDNRLRQLGFSSIPYDYYEYLGKDTVSRIVEDTLARVKERDHTDKVIRNPGGYLRAKLDAEVERARGMLQFSNPAEEADAEQKGEPKSIASGQELFRLADRLSECFHTARYDHAQSVLEALEPEDREELTALMLKDIFSTSPTLVAPIQVPETPDDLSPTTRRIAMTILLERQGRVSYQGALKDVRAFTFDSNLFAEFAPGERERIIKAAETAD